MQWCMTCLERDCREPAQAHELRYVDKDCHTAGQYEENQGWECVAEIENPGAADIAVQEGPNK